MRSSERFTFSYCISPMAAFILFLFCTFAWPLVTLSAAFESLNTTRSIGDGDTLVSAGGIFELGFFSLGSSTKRYLGIWYSNSVTTVPWVANRETPLADRSGVLQVNPRGILVLVDGNGNSVWSSNVSSPAHRPVVRLLDSGNLVVVDDNDSDPGNFIWQSFDYPCDTFIAGMKIGKEFRTGLDRYLKSWKNPDDPSPGRFTYRFELAGFPEIVVREDTAIRFRSGPYNGLRLNGMPEMNNLLTFDFVFNEHELYLTYNSRNSSILSRGVLSSQNGAMDPFVWNDPNRSWIQSLPLYVDNCDQYALCGANGICDNNKSPASKCTCITGFSPNNPKEWDAVPGTGGCRRKTELNVRKVI